MDETQQLIDGPDEAYNDNDSNSSLRKENNEDGPDEVRSYSVSPYSDNDSNSSLGQETNEGDGSYLKLGVQTPASSSKKQNILEHDARKRRKVSPFTELIRSALPTIEERRDIAMKKMHNLPFKRKMKNPQELLSESMVNVDGVQGNSDLKNDSIKSLKNEVEDLKASNLSKDEELKSKQTKIHALEEKLLQIIKIGEEDSSMEEDGSDETYSDSDSNSSSGMRLTRIHNLPFEIKMKNTQELLSESMVNVDGDQGNSGLKDASIESLKNEVEDLKASNLSKDKELKVKQTKIRAFEKELLMRKSSDKKAREFNSNMEKEHRADKNKIKLLKNEVRELQEHRSFFIKRTLECEDIINMLHQKLSTSSREYEEASKKLQAELDRVSTLQKERETDKKKIKFLEDKVKKLEENKLLDKEDLKYMLSMLQDMEDCIDDGKKAIQVDIQAECDAASTLQKDSEIYKIKLQENEVEKIEEKEKMLDQENLNNEAIVKLLQAQLSASNEEYGKARKELQAERDTVSTLQKENSDLKDSIESLINEVEDLKASNLSKDGEIKAQQEKIQILELRLQLIGKELQISIVENGEFDSIVENGEFDSISEEESEADEIKLQENEVEKIEKKEKLLEQENLNLKATINLLTEQLSASNEKYRKIIEKRQAELVEDEALLKKIEREDIIWKCKESSKKLVKELAAKKGENKKASKEIQAECDGNSIMQEGNETDKNRIKLLENEVEKLQKEQKLLEDTVIMLHKELSASNERYEKTKNSDLKDCIKNLNKGVEDSKVSELPKDIVLKGTQIKNHDILKEEALLFIKQMDQLRDFESKLVEDLKNCIDCLIKEIEYLNASNLSKDEEIKAQQAKINTLKEKLEKFKSLRKEIREFDSQMEKERQAYAELEDSIHTE